MRLCDAVSPPDTNCRIAHGKTRKTATPYNLWILGIPYLGQEALNTAQTLSPPPPPPPQPSCGIQRLNPISRYNSSGNDNRLRQSWRDVCSTPKPKPRIRAAMMQHLLLCRLASWFKVLLLIVPMPKMQPRQSRTQHCKARVICESNNTRPDKPLYETLIDDNRRKLIKRY